MLGYEGRYSVTEFGDVFGHIDSHGCVRENPRKLKCNSSGLSVDYLFVNLYNGGGKKPTKIHQIVLEAFFGMKPSGYVCRHLDGNPQNNHVSNLKWGTSKENRADTIKHGRNNNGERNGRSKLMACDIPRIREMVRCGITNKDVAGVYGVNQSVVSRIKNYKSWKHIG